MACSSAEETIRRDVEEWFHAYVPTARVVHELTVGGCRADIAAIEPEHLTLVEIKSELDTLDRLPLQLRTFSAAAHDTILVAARRWWDDSPYNNGVPRLAWPHERPTGVDVWCHPQPDTTYPTETGWSTNWRTSRAKWRQHLIPDFRALLWILWRDEMAAEAAAAGIKVTSRHRANEIHVAMCLGMTGSQITAAVCRQLRARDVLRGDAPIPVNGEPFHG